MPNTPKENPFEVRDGAVYQEHAHLGEYHDGRFVPSKYLMEQPPKYQKRVADFAKANMPQKRHRFIVDPADMNAGDVPEKHDGFYSISIIDADDEDGFEVCSVKRPRLGDARSAAKEVAKALTIAGLALGL